MKGFTVLLVLILSGCIAGLSYAGDKPEGVPVASQTFNTDISGFGKVTFSSFHQSGDTERFNFYLMKEGQIVYTFPVFYGNTQGWVTDEIAAIAFRDLDGDGLKDVIIIANYITGMGPDGVIPFPVAGVYFHKETYFEHDETVNDNMNSKLKNKTIADVVNYFKILNKK